MTECRRTDDAGVYALGALDEREARDFELHLATCQACAETVADLAQVVHTLPMAAPQMVPPPELKSRIMAVVQAEADLFAAAEGRGADRAPQAARRDRWAWLRMPRLAPLAAAGMACAVLAAGIGLGAALTAGDDAPGPQVVAAYPAAKAPGSARVAVEVREDGSGQLVASKLPAPPDGKVWQVWLMDAAGKVKPTHALFTVPADGAVRVAIDGDVTTAQQVLVSAEPPGGSQAPTSPAVVAADLT
jgi:anti-sigma-K factor RskA